MKILFQEDKQESLHKTVHDSTDKHHDQEQEDFKIGENGPETFHGIFVHGKLQVHVNLEGTDEGDEQHDVGNDEGSDIVGLSLLSCDVVHQSSDRGRYHCLGQSLVQNLSSVGSFLSMFLLNCTHL